MEPLWSPVVATGGNQRQIGRARKGRKQAKTVAVRCNRLPREVHGKQGVCGPLPPVAEGPLPAKEGVDRQVGPCGWPSGGPMVQARHCNTIMRHLLFARAI